MTYRIHFAPPTPFVRRDVARLFDDLFASPVATADAGPAVTRTDRADRIELSLDVPGVAPEAIEVTLDGRTLSIAGSRGEHQWRRQLSVPSGTDASQLSATVVHGVLTVSIPKPTAPAPQKVPVQLLTAPVNAA
jgi:HSP20 family protein